MLCVIGDFKASIRNDKKGDSRKICITFKGPQSATPSVLVYMQEFGYYILFGAWRNEEKSL